METKNQSFFAALFWSIGAALFSYYFLGAVAALTGNAGIIRLIFIGIIAFIACANYMYITVHKSSLSLLGIVLFPLLICLAAWESPVAFFKTFFNQFSFFGGAGISAIDLPVYLLIIFIVNAVLMVLPLPVYLGAGE